MLNIHCSLLGEISDARIAGRPWKTMNWVRSAQVPSSSYLSARAAGDGHPTRSIALEFAHMEPWVVIQTANEVLVCVPVVSDTENLMKTVNMRVPAHATLVRQNRPNYA